MRLRYIYAFGAAGLIVGAFIIWQALRVDSVSIYVLGIAFQACGPASQFVAMKRRDSSTW